MYTLDIDTLLPVGVTALTLTPWPLFITSLSKIYTLFYWSVQILLTELYTNVMFLPLLVLHEDKIEGSHKSFIWVYLYEKQACFLSVIKLILT